MLTLAITFLVIFFLAILRLGVSCEYSGEGLYLAAIVGPFRKGILTPGEEDKKDEKKLKKAAKKEKKAKEPKEKEKKPKTGGKLSELKPIIAAAVKALGRLRRKLRVSRLILHYTAASDDAYKAAMAFGYASAGVGTLLPVLDNLFNIRRRSITTDVSFTRSEPVVYIKLTITVAVWEIIYIAAPLLAQLIKNAVNDKKRKAEENG